MKWLGDDFMHGPYGGGPRGGHGPHGGGPRGGYGPRGYGHGPGGYGHGPHGFHGPHGYHGPHGHHRPHYGYYGRRRKNKNYVRRSASDGSMWQEFKSTMSYSLKKHSVFGLATGLLSFVLINPIQDMSYTYRKNALQYSKDKKRITEEQYKLRMIKLEESNCAHMYRSGMIDADEYDQMMDAFEKQYSIEESHRIK